MKYYITSPTELIDSLITATTKRNVSDEVKTILYSIINLMFATHKKELSKHIFKENTILFNFERNFFGSTEFQDGIKNAIEKCLSNLPDTLSFYDVAILVAAHFLKKNENSSQLIKPKDFIYCIQKYVIDNPKETDFRNQFDFFGKEFGKALKVAQSNVDKALSRFEPKNEESEATKPTSTSYNKSKRSLLFRWHKNKGLPSDSCKQKNTYIELNNEFKTPSRFKPKNEKSEATKQTNTSNNKSKRSLLFRWHKNNTLPSDSSKQKYTNIELSSDIHANTEHKYC